MEITNMLILKVAIVAFVIWFVPMIILLTAANIGSGGAYGWVGVFFGGVSFQVYCVPSWQLYLDFF